VPLSEADLEVKMNEDALRKRAMATINEQRDEVKAMNQMMLYAKVATIRDRQVDERKDIVDSRKIEEKRKDLVMEIDRLRKIKYYEELEREKKEEQRKGHLVIVDQIKERDLQRLKAHEEREREGQEMLKHIRTMQREESENALKRKADIK